METAQRGLEPELHAAFRAAFEAELDYVWTNLRRLGIREADREDVAHEVFVRILVRFREFDRTRPIRPWLFGFIYRVAADYRKLARHRRELLVETEDPIDPAPLADAQLVAADAKWLVDRCLEELDLDKRAVFIAHDVEGQTAKEIAENLGIPLFTIYSRLRAARETFKKKVMHLSVKGAAR